MSSEQRNLDLKEAVSTWARYFSIWKTKSILTLCSDKRYQPNQVQRLFKRKLKGKEKKVIKKP